MISGHCAAFFNLHDEIEDNDWILTKSNHYTIIMIEKIKNNIIRYAEEKVFEYKEERHRAVSFRDKYHYGRKTGFRQLNRGKIATGPIKPVFFLSNFSHFYVACVACLWYNTYEVMPI